MNEVSTTSGTNNMPSSEQATTNNISVAVRIRPLSNRERNESVESVTATSASGIRVMGRQITVENRVYEFDSVFGPQATQEDVYAGTVGNLVKDNIYKGFNGTILAYGQTGSGESRVLTK